MGLVQYHHRDYTGKTGNVVRGFLSGFPFPIFRGKRWIGGKSAILPGVVIGRGSIIAEVSVVTRDVLFGLSSYG